MDSIGASKPELNRACNILIIVISYTVRTLDPQTKQTLTLLT